MKEREIRLQLIPSTTSSHKAGGPAEAGEGPRVRGPGAGGCSRGGARGPPGLAWPPAAEDVRAPGARDAPRDRWALRALAEPHALESRGLTPRPLLMRAVTSPQRRPDSSPRPVSSACACGGAPGARSAARQLGLGPSAGRWPLTVPRGHLRGQCTGHRQRAGGQVPPTPGVCPV